MAPEDQKPVAAATQTTTSRPRPAAWKSLIAGATAGGIEGAATYPFEYAKTMMQFRAETGANASSVSPLSLGLMKKWPQLINIITRRSH